MELIPILSTIILVATISTFILAIGAYILYKVREAKGQHIPAPRESELRAELITPAAAHSTQVQENQPSPVSSGYAEKQSGFYQKDRYARQPMQPKFTPRPQQYKEPSTGRMKKYNGANVIPLSEKEKSKTETKFLKYTSDGYVDAKKDKDSGALKWR